MLAINQNMSLNYNKKFRGNVKKEKLSDQGKVHLYVIYKKYIYNRNIQKGGNKKIEKYTESPPPQIQLYLYHGKQTLGKKHHQMLRISVSQF